MCGLVAIINKNTNGTTQEQNEVFSTLLFLDLLRGADSTGVMCIENNGDLSLAKEAVDSLAFIRTKEYQSLLTKAFKSGSALIGHNRKATRGVVNDENAHPFVVDDNIVLVHNGTMYGDHKKHADTEVDSHAIAHVIHETGDVEAALNKIDAAYALIWYNVKEGTINFVRNTSRPLWWMETHNAWYFCSEKEMLDFAAKRHKLNLKEQPAELPHDLLQTFKLRNHGGWESDNKKIKIESKYQYQGNSMGKYYPGASAWAMPG
jgi:glucosamine 6-phosphate synthetase-like amidotransferase/phosphosugar isomerase protein